MALLIPSALKNAQIYRFFKYFIKVLALPFFPPIILTMDFASQIKNLFKPSVRPHPLMAELSSRSGKCAKKKDFQWLEVNIPCQNSCPAGTDIPAYLTAIAEGNPNEAYRINLCENVFPAVLGRVCSRPCEPVCRHGREGLGDPVAICFSKRSAADFAQQEPILLQSWFPSSGKRAAVIGAGVAGLTIARNLKLMGHEVTIYEKESSPGGMLNQGIPAFRLPREIAAHEIKQITGLGIELICNTVIGRDQPFSPLLNNFDAVIAATGANRASPLKIPGHNLPGIRHGLDFLREVNLFGRSDIGGQIIVIGGGFTAMDCARTARRLGAQTAMWNLKVLYRRSQDVMRITPGELEELNAEGIQLECRAVPIAYLENNGKLAGMRFRRSDSNETFEIQADTVLLATGQSPDHSWAGESVGTETMRHRKIFTAGDCALGGTSLIEAIAHAKETAEKVDVFLMRKVRLKKSVLIEDAVSTGRIPQMDKIPRQAMPSLPLAERELSREVETGYEEAVAVEEAKRCYRCHYKFEIDQEKCIKCDWCLKAKPVPECILMLKDMQHDSEGKAISWESTDSVQEMKLIWINQDACIRCGACLKVCPVDAIYLQKVSLCTEAAVDHEPCLEESS